MPWCDDCSRFWNPASMAEGATCPTCGRPLSRPTAGSGAGDGGSGRVDPKNLDLKALAGEDSKAPWHFKLLIVLVVLYLGWRIFYLLPGVG